MTELSVFYDLARNPPTFDVLTFLMRVEQERRRSGHAGVMVEFLPGPKEGFRADDLWPRSTVERREMLSNVAVPLCSLLPSCRRVVVHYSRSADDHVGFGVNEYMIPFKFYVDAMATGLRPLRAPEPVERCPGLITITLRESAHWPERNSNVAEWGAAARYLLGAGHRVVVVRDTLHENMPLGDFKIDAKAARDLTARARLYASADLNMFVGNGPAWMALAMDVPTLIFKPTTENSAHWFSARYFEHCGIPVFGQIRGTPKHQALVWSDDRAEVIVPTAVRFLKQAA